MKTNLEIVDPDIVGGHKIAVVENNIRNFPMHNSLEQITRLMFFCLECDSNNTNSKVLPSEVRDIRAQLQICKDEFEFAIQDENNDAPRGSYEYAYKILIPNQKELARIRNVKMKRVMSELLEVSHLMLSIDSANTQNFIAKEDSDKISQRLALANRVLDRWIGSGANFNDVGLIAPAYEQLGKVIPDVDGDYSQSLEPSKRMPEPRFPDVADSPLDGADK